MYNESCHDLNNGIESRIITADAAKDYEKTCRTLYCDHKHLFTDYILFDVLFLAVYVCGVYLFRSEDCGDLSYLHNLASRVRGNNGGREGGNEKIETTSETSTPSCLNSAISIFDEDCMHCR